jgi:hypothetical protein
MSELVVRAAPAQDLASLLSRFLSDETLTPDKAEIILRMRRELVDEERRESWHEAFSALQAVLPQIPKNGIVKLKTGQYNFARYEHMMAALQPLLAEHGFSVSFTVLPATNGLITVRCELMRNGWSKYSDSAPLPPDTGPGRNSAQAAGSSTTYGKRYALTNALNLVWCGADDDALSVIDLITDEQVRKLENLLDKTMADQEAFLTYAGVQELHEIRACDYKRLEDKINKVAKAKHERSHTGISGPPKSAAAARNGRHEGRYDGPHRNLHSR